MLSINLFAISPVIALSVAGFIVILTNLFFAKVSRIVYLGIALVGFVAAALFTFQLWNGNEMAFGGMVVSDNYSLTFNCIFIAGAVLSVLLAMGEHEGGYLLYPEYFSVTLFATVGMILMAASNNLLVIFLGLETLSISLYILAAIKRTESNSLESAFKYFLLGAFASAFLLYGIAFIYGGSGSLNLSEITAFVHSGADDNRFLAIGGLLIIVGLGFKVAMFPFHMWAPDVYQGAPTPIAAFMSTGSKAAGFATMLRVLSSATNGTVSDWILALSIIAVFTMFVGNIAAIVQSNVKRMLAYSSIAHAGYVLVGVIAWNEIGAAAVIFYLLVYTFMNVGAFGVLSLLSSKSNEVMEIDDFKGLAYKRPFSALVMATFMFALAGLPPTAGFMGKFYLFAAAVKAGYVWLVVLGVINSLISLYYYLGVVVAMFMKKSDHQISFPALSPAISISLVIAVLGSLGLGIFPSYLLITFEHLINVML